MSFSCPKTFALSAVATRVPRSGARCVGAALFSLWVAGGGLVACSNSEFLGSSSSRAGQAATSETKAASPGVAADDRKGKEPEKVEEEDASELAAEPQMVSGTFLACAFMDSGERIISDLLQGGLANIGIGCGLYQKEGDSWKKFDTREMTSRWTLMVGPSAYGDLQAADSESSAFDAVVAVPPYYLAATIQLVVSNGKEDFVWRRSIPTISIFNGKAGFRVEDDFANVNATIDGSATPAPPEPSAPGSSPGPSRSPVWEALASLVSQIFGSRASEPVSNDDGRLLPPSLRAKVVLEGGTINIYGDRAAQGTALTPPQSM